MSDPVSIAELNILESITKEGNHIEMVGPIWDIYDNVVLGVTVIGYQLYLQMTSTHILY